MAKVVERRKKELELKRRNEILMLLLFVSLHFLENSTILDPHPRERLAAQFTPELLVFPL